ncbi:hypothetical protein BZG36_03364 [Bifiguratus adelaidae]|uniref:AAA+ ATPase domain-containing protein n=1 Tax=Bifiguratus adelaidae TaxID=1938954 RepID=A0A261XXM8_9FUNG|nr:hypothetical protein BZG36_03364 [Bifiguratus adelaidae]
MLEVRGGKSRWTDSEEEDAGSARQKRTTSRKSLTAQSSHDSEDNRLDKVRDTFIVATDMDSDDGEFVPTKRRAVRKADNPSPRKKSVRRNTGSQIKKSASKQNKGKASPKTKVINASVILSQKRLETFFDSSQEAALIANGFADDVWEDLSLPQTQEEQEGTWNDIFAPKSEADLAVHKRKVNEVADWLVGAFNMSASRDRMKSRILLLLGPTGTGKTATIRVLSQQLQFDIAEWFNPAQSSILNNKQGEGGAWSDEHYASIIDKCRTFLQRSNRFRGLQFADEGSSISSPPQLDGRRKIVLIEDLPNITNISIRQKFHAMIHDVVNSPYTGVPLILIASIAGVRDGSDGDATIERRPRDDFDVRTIVPKELALDPRIKTISFNEVAPTIMRKALERIQKLTKVQCFDTKSPNFLAQLETEFHGDLRLAVNTMQFWRSSKKSAINNSSNDGASTTLTLFHALGKVLYAKRIDRPIAVHATTSQNFVDLAKTHTPEWIEFRPNNPFKDPPDTIMQNLPVDHALFTLFLHQNYLTFVDDIDGAATVSEWFSLGDDLVSTGGWERTVLSNLYACDFAVRGYMSNSRLAKVSHGMKQLRKPELWSMQRQQHQNKLDMHALLSHILPIGSLASAHGNACVETIPMLSIMSKARKSKPLHAARDIFSTWSPGQMHALQKVSTYTTLPYPRQGDLLTEKNDVVDEEEMASTNPASIPPISTLVQPVEHPDRTDIDSPLEAIEDFSD